MIEIFRDIPRSLYSPGFYRDLIQRGHGIGSGYIAVGLILLIVHMFLIMLPSALKFQNALPAAFADLPEITISDGSIDTINHAPAVVRLDFGGADSRVLILDPQQDMDDADGLRRRMERDRVYLLLGANKFAIASDGRFSIKDLNLPKTDMRVGHAQWQKAGDTLRAMVLPVLIGTVVIGACLGVGLRLLVGGLAIMMLAALFRCKLSYAGAVRLAAATAIPSTLFITVAPLHSGMFYAFWLLYALFALSATRMDRPVDHPAA